MRYPKWMIWRQFRWRFGQKNTATKEFTAISLEPKRTASDVVAVPGSPAQRAETLRQEPTCSILPLPDREVFAMSRNLLLLLVLALSSTYALGQGAPAHPDAALTVIKAGRLIDGASETPRQNQLIFVRGERIEKVTDASAAIPVEAKVIDLAGATVLPGLIDAHTHIFLWGEDPAKGGYDASIR